MAQAPLEGFIREVTGESHFRVEQDLGGGFVRLQVSEAERRQAQQDIRCSEDVVLELLRNARDAGARLICIATGRDAAMRSIVMIDDGEGIPEEMWGHVFEPRVTSRLDSFHDDQWGVHGRGMALFSIASNSADYGVVQSGRGLGTAIRVITDTNSLGERADQSSMPQFAVDADGRRVVRGPRNINRIVTEFTLAQRGSCLVYLGSANEVLATLVNHGRTALSAIERAFPRAIEEYPVCLRPALAATPEELAEIAESIGLSTSARSARRILDGEIAPLVPFTSSLQAGQSTPTKKAAGARRLQVRAPRIQDEDRTAFGDRVKSAYSELARAYYLESEVEPEVQVKRSGLYVFIPFVEPIREDDCDNAGDGQSGGER